MADPPAAILRTLGWIMGRDGSGLGLELLGGSHAGLRFSGAAHLQEKDSSNPQVNVDCSFNLVFLQRLLTFLEANGRLPPALSHFSAFPSFPTLHYITVWSLNKTKKKKSGR